MKVIALAAMAVVLGGQPANLVASPAVRKAIRASFLRTHAQVRAARVRGPLKGTLYYGRSGATYWALATFSVPPVGTTDQPEAFRRRAGGRWRDLGDNGQCKVPRALIRVWRLQPSLVAC